jgi:hypothetical protein
LIATPGVPAPAPPKSGWRLWWDRFWDSGDRAARRSYRRSLPALYRWRRVLVGLLVLASVIGAVVLTNGSPTAWARDRWSDVFYRDRLQEVWVSEVFIEPADATADGAPQMLVDNDSDAWTMTWTAETAGIGCRAPGTGVIVLTFPARRIRQIDLYAGLQDPQTRAQEFIPQRIGVAFGDADPCLAEPQRLENEPTKQSITVDSGVAVTTLRIAVHGAFAPVAEPVSERLSFTDIKVLARVK